MLLYRYQLGAISIILNYVIKSYISASEYAHQLYKFPIQVPYFPIRPIVT